MHLFCTMQWNKIIGFFYYTRSVEVGISNLSQFVRTNRVFCLLCFGFIRTFSFHV